MLQTSPLCLYSHKNLQYKLLKEAFLTCEKNKRDKVSEATGYKKIVARTIATRKPRAQMFTVVPKHKYE